MMNAAAYPHGEIHQASRLAWLSTNAASRNGVRLAVLTIAGALAAAAVAFVPLPARVPGHAILKAALPMVVGVAIAPQQGAGTIASISAAATTVALVTSGLGGIPAAALTALLALGPAIDLATRGARSGGWRLYLRFGAAGLAANLLAFAVRWMTAGLGIDGSRFHALQRIDLAALASFAACGLFAGLLSAALCFRSAPRPQVESAP